MNVTRENPRALVRLLRSPLALLAIFGAVTAVVAALSMGIGVQMGSVAASRSAPVGLPDREPQLDDAERSNGLACPIVDDEAPDAAVGSITSVEPHASHEGQLRGLAVIPVNSMQYAGNNSQPFPEITALIGETHRGADSVRPSSSTTHGDSPSADVPFDSIALWLLGFASFAALVLGLALLP